MVHVPALDRPVITRAGAPIIPEGWALVPIEPTPEMLAASYRAIQSATAEMRMRAELATSREGHDIKARHRWAEMLKACPAMNGVPSNTADNAPAVKDRA